MDEKYDVFGCNLARDRVFRLALSYMQGNPMNYSECVRTEQNICKASPVYEDSRYSSLRAAVEQLLPEELEECGPANNTEFVEAKAIEAAKMMEVGYDRLDNRPIYATDLMKIKE